MRLVYRLGYAACGLEPGTDREVTAEELSALQEFDLFGQMVDRGEVVIVRDAPTHTSTAVVRDVVEYRAAVPGSVSAMKAADVVAMIQGHVREGDPEAVYHAILLEESKGREKPRASVARAIARALEATADGE